jgi:hypothetical protein
MSNPKEKAKDLVEKFIGIESGWSDNVVTDDIQAKECALIAVDEIIESNDSFANSMNIWYDENGKIADYDDCRIYWQQVKQEIQNL